MANVRSLAAVPGSDPWSRISRYSVGNIVDCLTLVLPCFMFADVRLIGRLFLPEAALVAMLPFLVFSSGRALRAPFARTVLLLGALWLASLIVTDLVRDTPFNDYSRGWSKIVFALANFAALFLLLAQKPIRFALFTLGWAVGALLSSRYNPASREFIEVDPWKFGIGFPVNLFVVVLLCTPWLAKKRLLQCGVLLTLSAVNIVFNTRSLGGVCFFAATYVLAQHFFAGRPLPFRRLSLVTQFTIPILVVLALWALTSAYAYAATNGMLGEKARDKFQKQAAGKYGILIGARYEPIIAAQAIKDSPILGHGSWPKEMKYVMMIRDLQKLGYIIEGRPENFSNGLIPTHSHLTQAWVEAGVLGALFWLWTFRLLWRLGSRFFVVIEPLSPLIVFLGTNLAWDILFSPFSAERRVLAPFVLCLMFYAENVTRRQLAPPPLPTRRSTPESS